MHSCIVLQYSDIPFSRFYTLGKKFEQKGLPSSLECISIREFEDCPYFIHPEWFCEMLLSISFVRLSYASFDCLSTKKL